MRQALLGAIGLAVALVGTTQASDRPRIGLALGGGAARGLAHVGVLLWLEEHRVPVDFVAGTSMGGLVGGTYATGIGADSLAALVRGLDWERLFAVSVPYDRRTFRRREDARELPVQLELGLRGGLRLPGGLQPDHAVALLLSRLTLPYSDLEDLPIPFRCTATDLAAGTAVVLERGSLPDALQATMAIPGIFDPVRIDGRLLVDGGVLDNVPVDPVRAMGAEVVVAVDVLAGTDSLLGAELLPVVARALDVMTRRLSEPSLARADVVLQPDLRGLPATAFAQVDTLVARGHEAAAARAPALLRYALSAEAWGEYLVARQERRQLLPGHTGVVRVAGVPEPTARRIESYLARHAGPAPDPEALEADLYRLIGSGRYRSATYRLAGVAPDLAIGLREKSHAPPLVNLGLHVHGEPDLIEFDAAGRVTFLDLANFGSELRLDLGVGTRAALVGELFLPLRGRLFLAPRAGVATGPEYVQDGDDLLAVYRKRRIGAGGDLGVALDDFEVRAGYDVADAATRLRIGTEGPPETAGREQAARMRVALDRADHATLPGRGARGGLEATWTIEEPGAVRDYGQIVASLDTAVPLRDHDRVWMGAEGGATVGGEPPPLERLALGGALRLESYGESALRARHVVLGRAAYFLDLGRIPEWAGGRAWILAAGQAGSAFDAAAAARLAWSAGLALAADTRLGAASVGAFVGSEDTYQARFTLGRLFP